MSLHEFHLPEHEYEGDDRFDRVEDLIRDVGAKLRDVASQVNEKLSMYNDIQLNAFASPARDRRPCFEL